MDQEQLVELVARSQEGDQQAFGQLVEEFQPLVMAVAQRRLRNQAEAEEIAQDVMLQAYRKLSQLRDPQRFVGWLRQIASRLATNRAIRRAAESTQHVELIDQFQSNGSVPLDDLLHHERVDRMRGGLDRLRELDRRTLIAFYFEGRSLKEMSADFDSPVGTIKRRLHTARSRLRDELCTANA